MRISIEPNLIRYYNDDNQLHRDNGPAVIYSHGTVKWYQNDLFHREDGPAIEYASGTKEWYYKDHLHRKDGPAIEYYNGNKEWWCHGLRHREDGPAVEFWGVYSFYLEGKRFSKKDYYQKIKLKLFW